MTDRRPVVCLLAAPTSSAVILFGLYDVPYSVGAPYPDRVHGAPGRERLDVRIVSADGKPFRCPGNVLVEPQESLASLDACDAVVVCDIYSPIPTVPRDDYAAYGDWMRGQNANGTLTARSARGPCCWRKAVCWMGARSPRTGPIPSFSRRNIRASDCGATRSCA